MQFTTRKILNEFLSVAEWRRMNSSVLSIKSLMLKGMDSVYPSSATEMIWSLVVMEYLTGEIILFGRILSACRSFISL